jgi:hypothetical protein
MIADRARCLLAPALWNDSRADYGARFGSGMLARQAVSAGGAVIASIQAFRIARGHSVNPSAS